MSHMTFYIHMITSRMLGSMSDGPGRLNANYFYTRNQSIGGSKDSNDTLSTVFDRLHGGTASWINPAMFRSGFNAAGIIPGAAATTEAAPLPPAVAPPAAAAEATDATPAPPNTAAPQATSEAATFPPAGAVPPAVTEAAVAAPAAQTPTAPPTAAEAAAAAPAAPTPAAPPAAAEAAAALAAALAAPSSPFVTSDDNAGMVALLAEIEKREQQEFQQAPAAELDAPPARRSSRISHI
jgi:hypothetical protein